MKLSHNGDKPNGQETDFDPGVPVSRERIDAITAYSMGENLNVEDLVPVVEKDQDDISDLIVGG